MDDVVIPKFRERIAKGETFFNNMNSVWRSYAGSGTGCSFNTIANACTGPNTQAFYVWNGNWTTKFMPSEILHNIGGIPRTVPKLNFIIDQGVLRDLRSQVSTEMLNQRGRADSNLFESIAELDKTVAMFDRPISRLFKQYKSALKAKKDGRFQGFTIDGVSNLWLAYRYGIMPAVNDIQGIIDGLKAKTELRRETTRAKKLIYSSKTVVENADFDIIRTSRTLEVNEQYVVRAMSLDEFSLSLWENVGFTSKGLATVPWELVRYSFVVDWFINIGDFLGAITPVPGWKNIGSCMTTTHSVSNKYTIAGGSCLNPAYAVSQFPSGTYEIAHVEKTRSPVAYPDIVIKSDFRFDKVKRVADAFALLAQIGNRAFS